MRSGDEVVPLRGDTDPPAPEGFASRPLAGRGSSSPHPMPYAINVVVVTHRMGADRKVSGPSPSADRRAHRHRVGWGVDGRDGREHSHDVPARCPSRACDRPGIRHRDESGRRGRRRGRDRAAEQRHVLPARFPRARRLRRSTDERVGAVAPLTLQSDGRTIDGVGLTLDATLAPFIRLNGSPRAGRGSGATAARGTGWRRRRVSACRVGCGGRTRRAPLLLRRGRRSRAPSACFRVEHGRSTTGGRDPPPIRDERAPIAARTGVGRLGARLPASTVGRAQKPGRRAHGLTEALVVRRGRGGLARRGCPAIPISAAGTPREGSHANGSPQAPSTVG